MSRNNPQTWARVTRFDLLHLSNAIGNHALANLRDWPPTGEGRQVKAGTEEINRLLDRTFDRHDIHHTFDNLENVIEMFRGIGSNSFFASHVANSVHETRRGERQTYGEAVNSIIQNSRSFIEQNRPPRSVISRATDTSELPSGFPHPSHNDEPWQRLDELTPAQQSGPLQFEFRSGVLYVKPQASHTLHQDADSASKARASLSRDANDLILSLRESNVDRRLADVVSEVEEVISSGADVIRLGMINLTCEQLFTKFAEQLPDVAAARFLGFSSGIGLYLAQFPEWNRFIENAARANIARTDVEDAYQIGKSMLPALREAKGLVDPEVPKSVELILEALKNPQMSEKRALYGTVRTFENLLTTLFKEFAKLLKSISDGVNDGVKKATAIVVTTGLLLAAANTAIQLSPTAERVAKTTWLRTAGELVKNALSE